MLEDRLVDRVFEEDFEWRQVVRAYPLPALLVAAAVGFVVGRNHGPEILELLSETASERVVRAVHPPPR